MIMARQMYCTLFHSDCPCPMSVRWACTAAQVQHSLVRTKSLLSSEETMVVSTSSDYVKSILIVEAKARQWM